LIEAALPDMPGFDLVSWIRRCESKEIRTMPILMLTGYTQKQAIALARDCGANSVLKKPVSPHVLFDRIAWVARNERQFVETANYIGPDRRFKSLGPPQSPGRRITDLSSEMSASSADMSQDEIDVLIGTEKVKAS
ncbi:MAG: response regulator, partial [Alphaproteobacteria bacterium]